MMPSLYLVLAPLVQVHAGGSGVPEIEGWQAGIFAARTHKHCHMSKHCHCTHTLSASICSYQLYLNIP